MDWFDLIWLVSGIFIGCFIGFQVANKLLTSQIKELARLVSYHQSAYLRVLQRELANRLIRKDPERFLSLYNRIHAESEGLKSAESDVLKAKLLLLTEKYPQYEDFDLIETRDYVLYEDSCSAYSMDEIEQRYFDIKLFQALQSKISNNRASFSTTSDKELEHLKEYVQCILDTKFKFKLKKIISEFYKFRNDNSEALLFDAEEYSVRRLPDVAEILYGVHLKISKEFGLYSLYVFDDGKTHEGYFRSDENFQERKTLHDLNIEDIL